MSERDDLEGLRSAPGWLRLRAYVDREFNERLAQHIAQAASDSDDIAALNKIRQVTAAHREVNRVLNWPEARLAELTAQTQRQDAVDHPMLSRRGTL